MYELLVIACLIAPAGALRGGPSAVPAADGHQPVHARGAVPHGALARGAAGLGDPALALRACPAPEPRTMSLAALRLDGQVALVSGAGRGIGRGCALALAEAGAEVIALSRTAAELASLVAEIEAAGGRARAMVLRRHRPAGGARRDRGSRAARRAAQQRRQQPAAAVPRGRGRGARPAARAQRHGGLRGRAVGRAGDGARRRAGRSSTCPRRWATSAARGAPSTAPPSTRSRA